LDEIERATGASRRELQYRLRFAEDFPEVRNALHTFASWHDFCNQSTAHVSQNSGDNEWYTPVAYIDAARSVMGEIDLDPASTDEANEVIGASAFYSELDTALERDWHGRVWMNPPYARPLIDAFCGKLAEEFAADKVSQACVLVNNATETGWFHAIAEVASAFCFPRHRVKFWHPRKESATPLQGQAVIYLGDNADGFRTAFVDFGFTVVA
jgi:ParB family chromosome partitioning protein